MDKHEISEIIEKQLCKEVDQIAESIHKSQTISLQELEKLDKIYHTLKSKATYEAMIEASDYAETGMSGRRGRDVNGRYISRDSGSYNEGYENGYDRGYSEAMNHLKEGNSGHHYPVMPYYNEARRW